MVDVDISSLGFEEFQCPLPGLVCVSRLSQAGIGLPHPVEGIRLYADISQLMEVICCLKIAIDRGVVVPGLAGDVANRT